VQMNSYLLFLFLGIVYAQDDSCWTAPHLIKCAIAGKTATPCADGVEPTCEVMEDASKCPTCIPIPDGVKICSRTDIRECRPQETPSVETTNGELCATCKPKMFEKPDCSEVQLKACATKLLETDNRPAVCEAGVRPERDDTGCCVTCTPKIATCTPEQIKMCKSEYETTRECNADEKSSIGDNCCRTCKYVKDVPTRTTATRCSLADMKLAFAAIPDCEEGEKGLTAKSFTSCAPSCKRPESAFDMEDVIECLKDLPRCSSEEKPVRLPNTRCPACLPKRPACAVACAGARVCGRVPKNKTMVKKCLRKNQFKLRIKAKSAFSAKLKAFTASQMEGVLVEFVERYCERNGAADKCGEYLDRVRDSIKCVKKENGKDSTIITLEVAEDEQDAVQRRLLQDLSHEASDLVQDAVKDDTDLVDSAVVVTTGYDENSVSKNMVSHVMMFVLASISMLLICN